MRIFFTAFLWLLSVAGVCSAQTPRWTEAQANAWYAKQPWLVGSNYTPATAINELEMWQAETFDPQRIDLEFGWAESLGFNTMRVFLHDLLWQQDAAGFRKRIDTFLGIADKHHIKILFVLFDSCWDPHPQLGKQRAPTSGRAQFRLGAKSRRSGVTGSRATSTSGSLRKRCRRRVRQRPACARLGRLERTQQQQFRIATMQVNLPINSIRSWRCCQKYLPGPAKRAPPSRSPVECGRATGLHRKNWVPPKKFSWNFPT